MLVRDGNMGGTQPYPAPYISQEEQRASHRTERPIPPDPSFSGVWILVGIAVIIVIVVLFLIFSPPYWRYP